MSLRPIRIIIVVVGTLLVAAGAYTAYWYSAAAQMRAGIDRWAQDRRSAGWTVELGEPDITGFPARLEVFFQTPQITGPDSRWRWVAPNIQAAAAPWLPGEVVVSAPGIHVVTLRAGEIWAELDRAEADIVVGKSGVKNIVGRLSGVKTRLPKGESLVAESAVIRLLGSVPAAPLVNVAANTPRPDPSDMGIGVALDVRKVVLPAQWRPALGRNLGKVALDAVIMGKADPAGSLKDVLVRWRDAGGTLEVAALALDWDVLRLRTNGTFALDGNLQPEGAMVADIRGIDATMERLLAAGVIDSRAAFAARIANRALSFGGGSARLPLSLQKQRLYIGPAPILRIKPIKWN
ncbi:MAG: hypothetical protein ACI9JL_000278 [Paracoccaceae bacterium]|jgi:hypothetical protein